MANGNESVGFEAEGLNGDREQATPASPLKFEDARKRQAATNQRQPESPLLSDDQLVELGQFYSDQIRAALEDRGPLEQLWLKWLRLYAGKPEFDRKDDPWPGCSNLVTKVIQKSVNKVHARVIRSIFSIEPHWSAVQRNRQYSTYAKPLERYMDALRQDTWDQYGVVYNAVQEACIYGTSVIYNAFEDEIRWRYDANQRRPVEAGRRFGPKPMWIAREDYLQPAGYASPEAAPWCAVRMRYSFSRLQQLEHVGVLLPGTVDRLQAAPDDLSELAKERKRLQRAGGSSEPADAETGMWAPWLVHFRRDMDQDGYPEEYTALVHPGSNTVAKLDPNPFVDGMRPIVIVRFVKLAGEFDGMGIAEMLEHEQAEASTIHNQRRDSGTLANFRMWAMSESENRTESLKMKNFAIYKFSEPEKVRPLDLRDTRQIDAFEEQVVLKLADEIVGISEIGSGNISSPMGRAAASTVMASLQETSERFEVATFGIRQALDEQGNQICELMQAYGLPEPGESGSPESFLDSASPELGAASADPSQAPPTPSDAELVRELFGMPDSIRGLVKLKLNVASPAVNREVEKQSVVQLNALMTQYAAQMQQLAMYAMNPIMPPQIVEIIVRTGNMLTESMKAILQAFQRFDFESVLMQEALVQLASQPPDMKALVAQQTGMQPDVSATGGGGGSPGAGPGMPPTMPSAGGTNGGVQPAAPDQGG